MARGAPRSAGARDLVKKAVFGKMDKTIGNYETEGYSPIKRDFLTSITYSAHDTTTLPGYAFTYYDTFVLPDDHPDGWSAYQDEFGSYQKCNAPQESPRLCTGPGANTVSEAHAWSVETIRYPTGGTTAVTYEEDALEARAYPYWRQVFSLGSSVQTERTYSPYTLRQGGPRVKELKRYDHATAPTPVDLVHVRVRAWKRKRHPRSVLEVRRDDDRHFMRVYDRRGAAVYYDYVREVRSDRTQPTGKNPYLCEGVSIGGGQTVYTGLCQYAYWSVVDPAYTSSIYLQAGEMKTVIQDNSYMQWGHPYRVTDTAGDGTTTLRQYGYQVGVAARAFHMPRDLNVYWRPASRLEWEETTVRGSVKTKTTYDYSTPTTWYLRSVKQESAGLPTLVTERTYGFEKYSALDAANMLSPVVREDIYELNSTARTYYSAGVTLWSTATGSHGDWHPKYTYQWKANAPASSVAAFQTSWWAGGVTDSTYWKRASTTNEYDNRGRPTRLTDARGSTTLLEYTSTETLYNAYLEQVTRKQASGDLVFKMTYDGRFGQVASVTDATGTQVFQSYAYDAHGRLAQVFDASGAVVSQNKYYLAGASYTPTAPNSVRTLRPVAAGDTLGTTEYLDGRGRAVQTLAHDGIYNIVAVTDYDAYGRPYRNWNPFRAYSPGHGFIPNHQSRPRDGFTYTPTGTTITLPYARQTYDDAGRPTHVFAPYQGSPSGAQPYRLQRYLTDNAWNPDGTALPGYWLVNGSLDEEERLVQTSIDARGRERRRFTRAEIPAPAGTPATRTLTVYKSSAACEGIQAKSSGDKEDDLKIGGGTGGGPTTNLVNLCPPKIDSTMFTVPSAMLVRLDANVLRTGQYSHVEIKVDRTDPLTGNYAGNVFAASTWGSDYGQDTTYYFLAYPTITYRATITARVPIPGQSGTTGNETASGTVTFTFQQNGKITVPQETQFAYDAVGRLVKTMPPNYFTAPAAQKESFATLYTYNTLGQLVEKKTPDAGIEKYCYDRGGLLRFVERASDRASSKTLYFLYDLMGREIESGLLSASFTTACASVNTDVYPSSGTKTDRIVKVYDAQPSSGVLPWSLGSSVVPSDNVKGRLAAVATQSGGQWQVERYRYKASLGVVYWAGTWTQGVGAATDYAYVTHVFDRQGRVTSQEARRSVSGAQQYVTTTYTYTPLGQLKTVKATKNGAADHGRRRALHLHRRRCGQQRGLPGQRAPDSLCLRRADAVDEDRRRFDRLVPVLGQVHVLERGPRSPTGVRSRRVSEPILPGVYV